MNYSDPSAHVLSQQHQYIPGSDVIGIWPHDSANGNEPDFDSRYSFKRQRCSDDGGNENVINELSRARLPAPSNRGTANIFFKTRLCAKFKAGTCRNGESCNFAHGTHDLHQPPPNWQELVGANASVEEDKPAGEWDDDQRIIHKMKLCKKYYNGEECPYGDRCNFLHEEPSKFRDETVRFRDNSRESSVISIGTTPQPIGSSNVATVDPNVKPIYWKTKLCTKWEMTGQCQFGDKCHFAHGIADLQTSNCRVEIEVENCNTTSSKQHSTIAGVGEEDRRLLKLKDHRKLNRIYADWPDDLPFRQKPSSLVDNI